MIKSYYYRAYLVSVDCDLGREQEVGEFDKLSKALVAARAACYDAGIKDWDWVVDQRTPDVDQRTPDDETVYGELISRRSSYAGFEPQVCWR